METHSSNDVIFFCARRRTASPIRQKFSLLISKGNFGDSKSPRFQRLSASIGRFSTFFSCAFAISPVGKKTVTASKSLNDTPGTLCQHAVPLPSGTDGAEFLNFAPPDACIMKQKLLNPPGDSEGQAGVEALRVALNC